MPNKKDKKLSKVQKEYQEFAKQREPKRPVFKNCLRAFIVGGAICAFGQILQIIVIKYFGFTEKTAGYVLGTGGNMFKLAGSVIAFGVFSAFVVALIKMCLSWLGVV